VDYLMDAIRHIINELNRSLLPSERERQLVEELNSLIFKRKIMIATLEKPNDYRGSVDPIDPDDAD
jgi:hypothetical protein